MVKKALIGPIDLTSSLPAGYICVRECWDEMLEFATTHPVYARSRATQKIGRMWRCYAHQGTHRFKVDEQGRTVVDHPDCALETVDAPS